MDGVDIDKARIVIGEVNAMNRVGNTDTCRRNFTMGDHWNSVDLPYGERMRILKEELGISVELVRKHYILMASRATIAKNIPECDRDYTKSWYWHQEKYRRKVAANKSVTNSNNVNPVYLGELHKACLDQVHYRCIDGSEQKLEFYRSVLGVYYVKFPTPAGEKGVQLVALPKSLDTSRKGGYKK